MSKQILVCLPLREEQKRAMQQASGRTTVWNGSSPMRPGRTLIWPPVCCRNAVWSPMPPGLTALPSASGCWACGWGCRRISSSTVTARTAANGPPPATPSAACTVRGCSASAWGTSVRTLPAGRTHWGPRWWASAARSTRTPPAPITVCGWCPKARWTLSCPKPTLWP